MIISTITVLILFFTNNLMRVGSQILHIPYAILNIENCSTPHDYNMEGQVIKDDNMLEGETVVLQHREPGKKHECYSFRKRSWSTVVDREAKPSIVRAGTKKFKDQKLISLALSLNLTGFTDKEPVSMYYVDNYPEYSWADGTYSPHKKAITIKRGWNQLAEKTILAHEYLHYVWHRDKLEDDKRLVDELQAFYDRSSDLKQRMKNYTHEMTVATEFFSYGCTEWSDRRLSQYILEKCNQYIDRSKLSMNY